MEETVLCERPWHCGRPTELRSPWFSGCNGPGQLPDGGPQHRYGDGASAELLGGAKIIDESSSLSPSTRSSPPNGVPSDGELGPLPSSYYSCSVLGGGLVDAEDHELDDDEYYHLGRDCTMVLTDEQLVYSE